MMEVVLDSYKNRNLEHNIELYYDANLLGHLSKVDYKMHVYQFAESEHYVVQLILIHYPSYSYLHHRRLHY